MSARPAIAEVLLQRCDGDGDCGAQRVHERPDLVAVEEPLEIRLGKQRLAVLMRTPGDDFDLATGFVLSEGILSDPAQISNMSYCESVPQEQRGNILIVHPASDAATATVPERRFDAVSACGICGKASIADVSLSAAPVLSSLQMTDAVLRSLTSSLRQAQIGFSATGGLHAAGVFDAQGRLLCAREDIGRHNAVDKVIGALAAEGRYPLSEQILLCSGRASFEIVQKAAMARLPVVAAISAPSSLAIALARRLGITLVGFLNGKHYNIYAGPQRIHADSAA